MIRFRFAAALTLAAGLAAAAPISAAWAAPALPGQLSAVDVRTKIVGHSVINSDKTMTWWYAPTGTFEGDSGRATNRGDRQSLCQELNENMVAARAKCLFNSDLTCTLLH